ncbi:MAG: GvpL/GvpF family gas vesicle protein, partial [Thermoanaerobaculia bacterium]
YVAEMKRVVIGAHLRREDIEPLAEAMAVGDLWLSAVAVADDQPLSDRDLLLRVAGTRAALLDRATFVAIRYGFAVTNDADAAAKCGPHAARWLELLRDHRQEVELTLKIAVSSPQTRPDRHDFASGSAYLRALHAARDAATIDDPFRAAAEEALSPASERRWLHRDEKSIELAALVPRDRVDACFDAASALKARFPQTPFLLSGPWPLEVFADADHQ